MERLASAPDAVARDPVPAAPTVSTAPRAVPTPRRRRIRERRVGMERLYDGDIARTTITMPSAVDDALAEIVFNERKTTRRNKNDLMLEGVELVLKKYGKGSIGTLVRKSTED